VVKAPADSGLPLKGGDVILSIGGRKPTNPAHAMRILRSYDAGETVSIEIMRHQKRSTISWTVPDENRRWRARTAPRERGEQSMWWGPLNESADRIRGLQAAARRSLESARVEQRRTLEQSREQLEHLRGQLRNLVRRARTATAEI
ncbi:MAG TPA: PDZ domain-containing protein, partial [Gemmatimonadales bacterium]|nr:PDZ domain-containing protein [Gemmatimonadales bacterium]